MVTVLRLSLASMLVPIGALAVFFVSYAALYPAFWLDKVYLTAKAFEAATLLLALGAAAILWPKERFERNQGAAALLLALEVAVLAFLVQAVFPTLGRF